MYREAHSEGITGEQIEDALKILPMVRLPWLFPSITIGI